MFIKISQMLIALAVAVKLGIYAADDSRYLVIDPLERLEHSVDQLIDEIGRRRKEIRDGCLRAVRLAVAVHGVARRAIECGARYSARVVHQAARVCSGSMSAVHGMLSQVTGVAPVEWKRPIKSDVDLGGTVA